MGLEKSINQDGQEQRIRNFDKILKIGDKFLQVRLIETKKFQERHLEDGEFGKPLPRARFVQPQGNFYYLVTKEDLMKIKKEILNRKV